MAPAVSTVIATILRPVSAASSFAVASSSEAVREEAVASFKNIFVKEEQYILKTYFWLTLGPGCPSAAGRQLASAEQLASAVQPRRREGHAPERRVHEEREELA